MYASIKNVLIAATLFTTSGIAAAESDLAHRQQIELGASIAQQGNHALAHIQSQLVDSLGASVNKQMEATLSSMTLAQTVTATLVAAK